MDLKPAPRRSGERYSEEEIERGLVELAMCAGSVTRAQRQLKANGLEISRTALARWKYRHADRYEHLKQDVIPVIHARLAEESEQLASEYAEAERKTIDRYMTELPNLKAADAAGAARNMATAKGIAIDKANAIRGRPTAIIEHRRDPIEIIQALRGLGVHVVEGTAEEDEPEELPPAA